MEFTDKEAIHLLSSELKMMNLEQGTSWPLEPSEIRKQSSHFWEVVSNVGGEESLTILIDAQAGKLVKGRPRFRVGEGGTIVAYVKPVTCVNGDDPPPTSGA